MYQHDDTRTVPLRDSSYTDKFVRISLISFLLLCFSASADGYDEPVDTTHVIQNIKFTLGRQPKDGVFSNSESSTYSCYDNLYLVGRLRASNDPSESPLINKLIQESEIQVAWQGPTGKIWIHEPVRLSGQNEKLLLWSSMRVRHRQSAIPGASFLFESDADYSRINGDWNVRVHSGKKEVFRASFQIQC